jgi:eukaryotic-like serine/threonine-protein kinase
MPVERWDTLSPLLDELLELTGRMRERRLAEIEDTDPELARALEELMVLEEARPDFMSEPVVNAGMFDAQPGQEIGPYRLVSPIGEGGMGQVWLAVRADGLYERRVALKLLRPGLGDVGLHARFTRERQILARLGHAHIARLLDAGISADGQPYLALDYVRGDPITDYARARNLDLRARLTLFQQVCGAVSHAHSNLVVHRDLKPSNILVTSAGEVCLLDFGIAKILDQEAQVADITRTGSRAFTLHYAAPEQLRGEVITTMTDVYALGVVLYELLTDSRPYELTRHSDAAWEEAILGHEPGRPSHVAARRAKETGSLPDKRRARLLAGDLDNIVLKALSKLPEQRYASVEALGQDLRRYLEGQPVHARAQSFQYRARKYLRRHALGLGIGGFVTGVLAVSLAIVSWQASRAVQEASRAQAMQDFVVALFENSGATGDHQAVDVRALLDAGVARADTELAEQPRARSELIGLIARLRSGLGDDAQALVLLDRQQALLAAMRSPAPLNLQLDAAALRAHALRELGRQRDCLVQLGGVDAQARDAADRWPQQSAEFLSQLGRCHAQLRQTGPARKLFRDALKLRQRLPAGGAAVAESLDDLADLRLQEGKPAQAERELRAALAQLRSSGGEQNALGVDIWRDLGAAYDALSNPVEAKAAYRQALQIALARFGTTHPRTADVQVELAGVLLATGELAEAEQLLALVQDGMQARGAAPGPVAEQMSVRGMIALERDQSAQAEQLLGESVRMWRGHGLLANHAWDLCHLAQAQAALGHEAAAEASRRECLSTLRAKPGANTTTALVHIAQAALDRGDIESARNWLKQVPAGSAETSELQLVRARLAQMSRDPTAPLQIDALVASLPADRAHRRVRWQAQGLQAAQACRAGRTPEGLALRDSTLTELRRDEPENLRQLRRVTQLAAPCR